MIKLFYFSGTGNSLKIACEIANEFDDAMLFPMTETKATNYIGGEDETIGFVFPVYFNGLPRIVKRFVEDLKILPNTYCFAVANSGGTRSNVLGELNEILISKNLHLSFADEIKVFTNYIIDHSIIEESKITDIINTATVKAKTIAKSIAMRERKLPKRKAVLWSKIVRNNFSYKNASRWDEKFITNKKCVGCERCAKVCPASNIELHNQKPTWQHRCEKCLACLHWCPYEAIEYGEKTIGKKRYHNPSIEIEDMMMHIKNK